MALLQLSLLPATAVTVGSGRRPSHEGSLRLLLPAKHEEGEQAWEGSGRPAPLLLQPPFDLSRHASSCALPATLRIGLRPVISCQPACHQFLPHCGKECGLLLSYPTAYAGQLLCPRCNPGTHTSATQAWASQEAVHRHSLPINRTTKHMMAEFCLQPFMRECMLMIPSGGSVKATLCGKNGEPIDDLKTTVDSGIFYSIDCTSDPAPLLNFVDTLPDGSDKSTMQSIMKLPAENPRIVPFAILYGTVADGQGNYFLKQNHVRAIIVQSHALGPDGSIYDKDCPCCKTWSPSPPFVYRRFQHCAGVPRRAHTGCASCVWQDRDCHDRSGANEGRAGSTHTFIYLVGKKRKLSEST